MGFSQAGGRLLAPCPCLRIFGRRAGPHDARRSRQPERERAADARHPPAPAGPRVFFHKVHESFPDDIQALIGLGDSDFQERNWDGADGWYDRVLDQDPENPAAHYGRAVSRRETGKTRVRFSVC